MKNQNKPAFYFSTNEKKLRYNDDRLIVVGETHSVEGGIKLCRNGLHASYRLIDALNYAPGNVLYLVDCSGDIDIGRDKLCSRNRKYLAEFDAADVLLNFSRKIAMELVHFIKLHCHEFEYDSILDFLRTGNNPRYIKNMCDYYIYSYYLYEVEIRMTLSVIRHCAIAHIKLLDLKTNDFISDINCITDARAKAYRAVYGYVNPYGYEYIKVYNMSLEEQDKLLTSMIKEATGWYI